MPQEPVTSTGDSIQQGTRPQWLLEQEAAAYREMAPYIDRLQALGQRLGWPLGQLAIKAAVEQLERDHRAAGRSIN